MSDTSRLKTLAGYALLLGLSALGLFGVHELGVGIQAPEPAPGAPRFGAADAPHTAGVLLHVLLALLAIVAASRLFGVAFRYLAQPPVVGEVVAGIALGPSLLGKLAPDATAYLFPATVVPALNVIAQVGVILFMFLVGVELDTRILRSKAHTALAISHASIVAPFLLGAFASFWIYPRLSSRDVPFGVFAMFMGIAMSITAFPVLARILTDRGMQRSKLGVLALSCAAVDDVTAWCVLAFVVSLASAEVGGAWLTVALTVGYIGLVWFAVRPLVHRWIRAQELTQQLSKHAIPAVVLGLLCSALITELIGIHAIFGAFLLGATIPHESLLAERLKAKFEDLVVVLFLPAFFAFTGLRTQIGLVSGLAQWLMCLAIIVLACLGKFGGTLLAARLTGQGWRNAAALGALMNTRGLMELVVLNIGLDLRVLSPTLFAMMVLMAVVTTFSTSPLLALLQRGAALPEGSPDFKGGPA
jgi:Kef-type K+ transport system membrane component KefB